MHLCASCRLSYSTTRSAASCTFSELPSACSARLRHTFMPDIDACQCRTLALLVRHTRADTSVVSCQVDVCSGQPRRDAVA